jgi:large conductance mechanosensitive channel
MKELLEEFKTFILKGNIITIAVGLFIAAAFGELVTAFTKGIVDPLLGKIPGLGGYLSAWAPFGFGIGSIISACITFTAKAAVVFFFVVKPMNKLMGVINKPKDADAPPPPPPATLEDVVAELKALNASLKK